MKNKQNKQNNENVGNCVQFNAKTSKNKQKLSEYSVDSVTVFDSGVAGSEMDCELVISSKHIDIIVSDVGSKDERYEIKKNKMFLPKSLRNNLVKDNAKTLTFVEVPQEVKFLIYYVNEWFGLHKFMIESRIRDYLGDWDFEEFANKTFDSYSKFYMDLSVAGKTDREKIVLALKDSASFVIADDDTCWKNIVDLDMFDTFEDSIDYMYSQMKEVFVEFDEI